MPPVAAKSSVRIAGRVPWIASPRLQTSPARLIHKHWVRLGGSPGEPVSEVENLGSGHRIRYRNGAIYLKGDGKSRPVWVYGEIGKKYDGLGGPDSWLGYPTADEAAFSEGGRVSTFEHGEIYWWPDVGPIPLNQVVVHYTGLLCFGETDWDQGSDEDEPYVILGALASNAHTAAGSQIYEDVNEHQGRPDLIELYRGKPLGIALSATLMEHDEGDPDKYREAMAKGIEAAAEALEAIPIVGPIAEPILKAVAPAIAKELTALLDLGDDTLGHHTVTLSAKQMVVLAALTPNSEAYGVGFKVETPLFTGEGSSYKVCYGLVPA